MELSHSVKVSLHQKLVVMLANKLAPLRKLNFLGERKPTLDDYYKLNDACFPDHIPRSLSLPYFFENYNLFASNKFLGCKFEDRFDIACATWYWSTDKCHSFSRHSHQILVNFLLAGIVVAQPDQIQDPDLYHFLFKFICAFHAYNTRIDKFHEQEDFLRFWWDHKYDLIEFPARKIKHIMAKVKAMKHVPSHMPFQPDEFLDQARFQDRAIFGEYVVVWAVRWLFHLEKVHVYCEDLEKQHNALPEVFEDNLCASLAGIGVEDDFPYYVTTEHFTRPETQALLKDIEVVQPAKKIDSVMWMEPQAAAERLLDSDLSAVLQNIKL
ncbi:uncharacterized protein N0V89_008844 [Didymosphaeria variabile]|uniref:Uncharacterized protein n=1 Tax=Didymosphaeria variabile TaxID=1932322 RepID=A0A9W8XGZ9_9PLEO|nr:uncharacterized protein N0V89_008844 [Didymosphaeria variabile]KAJ4350223.1 hypothetical protein N0V89_008844 [Didymosphaeria variabile]